MSKPDKLSILWHSVSPFINSGYGKTTRYITKGLTEAGYKVIISAYYGTEPGGILNYNGIPILASKEGPFGVASAAKFARQFGVNIGLLFCYDENTEILTNKGWKKGIFLEKDDAIGVFNPRTNEINFELPEFIHINYYKGRMYNLENKFVNLVVSPNHKMYIRKRNSKDFQISKIEDINFKRVEYLIAPGPLKGEVPKIFNFGEVQIPSNLFMKLLGLYISEGFVQKNTNTISICQRKKEVREKIKELFKDIKINYNEYKERFDFKCASLARYFELLGHSTEKYIPRDILNLDRSLLEVLWEYLRLGDGWITKTGTEIYCTSSKRLADDVQELLLRCGYGAIIRINSKPRKMPSGNMSNINWSVSKIRNITPRTIPDVKGYKGRYQYLEEWKYYEGLIWCPVISTGLILVRRNGKPVISGNTDFWAFSEFPKMLPNATLYGPMDHINYCEEIINFTKMYYKIISLCKWQQNNLKNIGIDSECIYHGVDPIIFKPMDKDQCKQAFNVKDKFVFGTVAANSDKEDRKSHGRMMKAMRYFLDSNPDVKEQEIVWLYHSIPNDPRGMPLSSICHKFRLDNIIKFMDPSIADTMIPEENLAILMNTFDVHILCSKREGFGMPILETMSCGVSNICHDFSSMPELVKGHGWLCKSLGYDLNLETTPINAETASPDVYDIARCIKDAYFDEKKRTTYGRKSREFALKYTWDDLIRYQWVPFLENIQEDLRGKSIEERRML